MVRASRRKVRRRLSDTINAWRVLLTGGSGFLGRAFVEHLGDGCEVIALCRDSARQLASAHLTWVQADLRAPLPLRRLPTHVDAVVHLASARHAPESAPSEVFAVNAGAVASLLDYARRAGARRFVLGSTGGVYGYRRQSIVEAIEPRPFDTYTLSKWHGESIALQQRDVPVAVVRHFFPYGPGQTSGVVPLLSGRIASGQPITLYNGGRNPRINPVFVSDACELLRRAMTGEPPPVLNCAGPEVATVRQISREIARHLGVAPRFAQVRDERIGNMAASTDRARRALGFVPTVGLRQGLAASVVAAS